MQSSNCFSIYYINFWLDSLLCLKGDTPTGRHNQSQAFDERGLAAKAPRRAYNCAMHGKQGQFLQIQALCPSKVWRRPQGNALHNKHKVIELEY